MSETRVARGLSEERRRWIEEHTWPTDEEGVTACAECGSNKYGFPEERSATGHFADCSVPRLIEK